MRILTLLVRHGTDKFPGAIDDVAALFARQFHEVEWDLIVIDSNSGGLRGGPRVRPCVDRRL